MMDTQYYESQFEVLVSHTEKSAERQLSFFQHILIVASGSAGILISLHSNNSGCQYIRLAFVAATLLLLFACLTCAIVLYDHSQLVERGRQAFLTEVQNALRENRKVEMVFVPLRKRTKILTVLTFFLLTSSLFLLGFYVVANAI